MAELWLIFGILAYLSYAISTTIDKHMMNHHFGVLKTSTLKMFSNGLVLLIIGFFFFEINFTKALLLAALIVGLFKAIAVIFYYYSLELRDVQEAAPYFQAGELMFVFALSLIIFNETATGFNFLGVGLILCGIYALISNDGFKLPKTDKGLNFLSATVITITVFSLLSKHFLFTIKPIDLAISMYLASAVFIFIYQITFNKDTVTKLVDKKNRLPTLIVGSFFGAIGTLFLYTALETTAASKVYPLAGMYSVFVFILAAIFLKEKFSWRRLIGIAVVFAGIYLIAL